MKKKGVSPVVATVLLVAIAVVLAAIVFLWAKGFLAEKAQKFDEPIERSCTRVSFESEAIVSGNNLEIGVVNRGNVPIYGMEIREKKIGSIRNVGVFETTISSGDTARFSAEVGNIVAGDNIILVPMILGEIGGVKKSFTCDVVFGDNVEIK